LAHPYMASSVAALRKEMVVETRAATIEELFAQIPPEHRLHRPLQLPEQLASEAVLRRHLHELLAQNISCDEALSFLGPGATATTSPPFVTKSWPATSGRRRCGGPHHLTSGVSKLGSSTPASSGSYSTSISLGFPSTAGGVPRATPYGWHLA
jgi:Glycine cleavage system P-protein